MLSFFPRGVLDEILNLIESVSEGFSFLLFHAHKMRLQMFQRNDVCSLFARGGVPSRGRPSPMT